MSAPVQVVPLYRSILHQARLLSHTWSDHTLLRSHAHLARRNLEPLLPRSPPCDPGPSSSRSRAPHPPAQPPLLDDDLDLQWPPSTTQKRIKRARIHLRHLADANIGWPHAVKRAIDIAYARRGKLRRDALALLSPQPSSAPEEQRYPRRLRHKDVHPILAHLLTTQESMRGAAARPQHLKRLPPPYLPALDDPVLVKFGKRVGRTRMANAWRKWAGAQLKKVILPIDVQVPGGGQAERFRGIEERAASLDCPLPRRLRSGQATTTAGANAASSTLRVDPGPRKAPSPPYLDHARAEADRLSSGMRPQAMRKQSLRTHGWSRTPKDYARHARARRRIYAGLLEKSPLLRLASTAEAESVQASIDSAVPSAPGSGPRGGVGRDPLGLKAQLRDAMDRPSKASIGISEHATRRRGPRGAAPGSERALTDQEIKFLEQAGIVSASRA
ncbi:uncharacterized protein PFL1_02185 [Pseudozyma flocculosa PF-1]|uniref:Uncharacterized protein n=1 Tax=Pseudozyma flocculosa TaxID=84751 RepID=A0A5C3FD76_9BASI|nr:uncharacterized protein PFL1_02185 [Pseudozyma flocculosa PF-1]EPQ30068.1 hypothetical protein PFL1_02185 [Pseudozyma flocculosa PF-1]SPO41411.1 uncharacterized protein PSFLO_06893 [Pseudozyma flocculosa]